MRVRVGVSVGGWVGGGGWGCNCGCEFGCGCGWVCGCAGGCAGGCVGCLCVSMCVWGGDEFVCEYVGVGEGRSMWVSSSLGNILHNQSLQGFHQSISWVQKPQSAQSGLNY